MLGVKSRAFMASAFAFAMVCASYSGASAAEAKKKLSSSDTSFLKEAASGGLMEVKLGELAAQKGRSDKVKEFGKRMQDDHSKANDELKQLAADKGVKLPASMGIKEKNSVQQLSKLSGASFDREYMKTMISDHKQDVTKFQSESEKANDPDVKQFAGKILPTLKEHLQLAESTAKEVNAGGKK